MKSALGMSVSKPVFKIGTNKLPGEAIAVSKDKRGKVNASKA